MTLVLDVELVDIDTNEEIGGARYELDENAEFVSVVSLTPDFDLVLRISDAVITE